MHASYTVIYGAHLRNDNIFRCFFIFSKVWFFGSIESQKTVQNDKKLCLSSSISQEPYIMWLSFMIQMCKIISPGVFFNFKILIFWVFRGLKGQKMAVCCTLYIRNHISYVLHVWYTCMYERIISPDIFFIFFQNFDLSLGGKVGWGAGEGGGC